MASPTSTSTAAFGTATLTTTLDCNGADFCFNVPRPAVRGSTQLLLTVFIPIVTTAFKTLYMKASRKTLQRVLDFLLRLFFPEFGLLRVQSEEVDRSHFQAVLHRMGASAATRPQLMAIQQGKLHLSSTPKTSVYLSTSTGLFEFT
jgi:hypothetical protein